jgi:hypothetical protein
MLDGCTLQNALFDSGHEKGGLFPHRESLHVCDDDPRLRDSLTDRTADCASIVEELPELLAILPKSPA